jgi:ATP-dependent phosphoenolpyruvate carboxykinase
LDKHGIKGARAAYWNMAAPGLYEESIKRGEGLLAPGGALVVETGEYTGRSPKDKFIVEEATSRDNIWWGSVNQSISEEHFAAIRRKILDYYVDRDLFIQDSYAGADLDYRLNVRVAERARRHRNRVACAVYPQHVYPADGRSTRGFRSRLYHPARAGAQRRPRDRRDQFRYLRDNEFRRPRGADHRHLVRR